MGYSDDDAYYVDSEDYDDIDEYEELSECDDMAEYVEESPSFSDEMADLLVGALFGGAAVVSAAASKRKAERIEQEVQHEAILREQEFQRQQEKKAW